MFFQAIVAALVCLAATCVGFTEAYLLVFRHTFYTGRNGFGEEEEDSTWISKRRDLFYYIHIAVQ
jgi:hypothetical protein